MNILKKLTQTVLLGVALFSSYARAETSGVWEYQLRPDGTAMLVAYAGEGGGRDDSCYDRGREPACVGSRHRCIQQQHELDGGGMG